MDSSSSTLLRPPVAPLRYRQASVESSEDPRQKIKKCGSCAAKLGNFGENWWKLRNVRSAHILGRLWTHTLTGPLCSLLVKTKCTNLTQMWQQRDFHRGSLQVQESTREQRSLENCSQVMFQLCQYFEGGGQVSPKRRNSSFSNFQG
jgi:hypothetical protein